MKFFYFLLHWFTGCPEEDLKLQYHGSGLKCSKCGREFFNWSV